MNTTENNKLIDIFNDNYLTKLNGFECYYNKENRSYHNDWNLLMQVVEKIESLGFDFDILTASIVRITDTKSFEEQYYTEAKTKIEAVYNACVEFIKWFNENK